MKNLEIKNSKFKTKTPTILNFNLLILNSRRGGFTLIEIVMIIVIASIAIPTLLVLLGQQARYGVEAEIQVSETNLAQQLMEEIRSKCWDELKIVAGACTGTSSGGDLGLDPLSVPVETAGNPTTYDDIDDYRAGVPNISSGGITYTRTVQVCYVQDSDLNNVTPCVDTQASATNYKRISVTVTDPNARSVELVTVATNY